MVNGFPNYLYLKLCQIFIIRPQTTWTLPAQKRAEMNESEMKTEHFLLLTRRKMHSISTTKDKEIEDDTLKNLNQKVIHAIFVSFNWFS